MRTTGRLVGMHQAGKNMIIQLEAPCEAGKRIEAEKLADKDLKIEIYRQNQKRSLNANAYYWRLVGEMAKRLNVSNGYCHNQLLRRYGTLLSDEEQPWAVRVPDTPEAIKRVDEDTELHLMPTSKVVVEDGIYRIHMIIKGSHEYDTAEMSKLINGAVSEAQEMGIETMTPEEIQHLMDLYDKERQKHEE